MSIQDVTVVVMAKLPQPGRVKTRLLPALSPEQAALVHEECVRCLLKRLGSMHWRRRIACFDPPDAQSQFANLLPATGRFKLHPQVPGDLSARLAAAAKRFCWREGDRLLFLGADCPDLPTRHLQQAAQEFAANQVVLGPTDDGGYWCLGVRYGVDVASLLAGIEWSSGREFQQTLERARSLGYNTALADRWDDVDRPADLTRLLDRLKRSADPSDRDLLTRLKFLPAGVWP
ncbi:TIGR04282 family arsenosugar biosynthesis glycosyltransferase [soil metagenome]